MNNYKQIFDEFNNLNGAKFIAIKNHKSEKTGEIADFVVNTNIKVMTAKEKDYNAVASLTENDLKGLANENSFNYDTMLQAYNELLTSKKKNLSENVEDRTKQSQAITDAFLNVGNGLKIHKNTMELHITGFVQNKKVIQKGEYKKVNSREKTLCKKAIEKFIDARMKKYRTFKVKNIDNLKISGNTLIIG